MITKKKLKAERKAQHRLEVSRLEKHIAVSIEEGYEKNFRVMTLKPLTNPLIPDPKDPKCTWLAEPSFQMLNLEWSNPLCKKFVKRFFRRHGWRVTRYSVCENGDLFVSFR